MPFGCICCQSCFRCRRSAVTTAAMIKTGTAMQARTNKHKLAAPQRCSCLSANFIVNTTSTRTQRRMSTIASSISMMMAVSTRVTSMVVGIPSLHVERNVSTAPHRRAHNARMHSPMSCTPLLPYHCPDLKPKSVLHVATRAPAR